MLAEWLGLAALIGGFLVVGLLFWHGRRRRRRPYRYIRRADPQS